MTAREITFAFPVDPNTHDDPFKTGAACKAAQPLSVQTKKKSWNYQKKIQSQIWIKIPTNNYSAIIQFNQ